MYSKLVMQSVVQQCSAIFTHRPIIKLGWNDNYGYQILV